MAPRRTIVLGGNGQVGRALAAALPQAEVVDRDRLDLSDTAALRAWPWTDYDTIINAAAWTAVDAAEDERAGRLGGQRDRARGARRPRPRAPAHPGALLHRLRLRRHPRAAPRGRAGRTPRGLRPVQGGRRAGGRGHAPPLRAAHLVGDRRRRQLRADDGLARRPRHLPSVVDDQHGRLTFADELARATVHLLATDAPFGICTTSATAGRPPRGPRSPARCSGCGAATRRT